ncbi:hypothetical protein ACGF7W_19455 [Streptomyces sp. NPDC048219]|uniref:hypothetical protein n=1 Tax=Streptomyces sp. NPDC048219 TaxID=3365517 RepID=UPI0037188C10
MTTTSTVPPGALEALALPGLDALTDAQTRGADCIWCRTPLTADMAVDFGEVQSPLSGTSSQHGMRWYPRACPACAQPRAHRALWDHAPGCDDCRAAPAAGERGTCEISRGLYRLVRECRR